MRTSAERRTTLSSRHSFAMVLFTAGCATAEPPGANDDRTDDPSSGLDCAIEQCPDAGGGGSPDGSEAPDAGVVVGTIDAGFPDAGAPPLGGGVDANLGGGGGIGASCGEDSDCAPGLECDSVGGGERACALD